MRGHQYPRTFFSLARWREAHQPEKHWSTIVFPLFFQYLTCSICNKFCYNCNIFVIRTVPQSPLTPQPHLNSFWTFQKTPASAFLKIQIRIFFWTTITITQAIITTIIHYFQTLILRRLTHLPLYLNIQEPKNHTEEGSLSESRVVAPIASLILS